ncbi:MAG TPA: twin-arginine translocation signal domain-containing protein, partial [Verrucomicrobiae bacterium]|nr:twin-arginine translocation signal domain-containing protein [Verrucomicrobiae bacterium]
MLNALEAEMDRRRFLALLGSLLAAGALAGCASPVPLPSLGATNPASPEPSQGPVGRYELLRRLQAIIRQ